MTNQEAEDLRTNVNSYLRPDDTPTVELAKELADNTLHVNHLLRAKPETWTTADRDFIATEIMKGMANL
jgi:hypothetical protein